MATERTMGGDLHFRRPRTPREETADEDRLKLLEDRVRFVEATVEGLVQSMHELYGDDPEDDRTKPGEGARPHAPAH
jgi:hypothetical protein